MENGKFTLTSHYQTSHAILTPEQFVITN